MVMGKPRILLVDDETVTQQVLLGTLNRHGYECCVAQSTAEAEALLNGQEFNLMVLDIMMPGKSGIDFLPEVVTRFRDMPVLMLTAVEDTSIVVQAMRLGAYFADHSKPLWRIHHLEYGLHETVVVVRLVVGSFVLVP